MRFISIFSHEPRTTPPSHEEMARMGQLIGEGMQQGWLLATEGVAFGEHGFRMRKDSSGISVVDGPFTESKEVLGGYALLQASSREEVKELTRRFLEAAGNGVVEIYPLHDGAPGSMS